MNNNIINLKIAKTETALNVFLSQLPVGVAYLLLKNKMQQIEPLFEQQVMIEDKQQRQKEEQKKQDKGQE